MFRDFIILSQLYSCKNKTSGWWIPTKNMKVSWTQKCADSLEIRIPQFHLFTFTPKKKSPQSSKTRFQLCECHPWFFSLCLLVSPRFHLWPLYAFKSSFVATSFSEIQWQWGWQKNIFHFPEVHCKTSRSATGQSSSKAFRNSMSPTSFRWIRCHLCFSSWKMSSRCAGK